MDGATGSGQPVGHAEADPAIPARNNRDFAREIEIAHRALPVAPA
jgi:hypothetical protein